jgi:hypothetical protein
VRGHRIKEDDEENEYTFEEPLPQINIFCIPEMIQNP